MNYYNPNRIARLLETDKISLDCYLILFNCFFISYIDKKLIY